MKYKVKQKIKKKQKTKTKHKIGRLWLPKPTSKSQKGSKISNSWKQAGIILQKGPESSSLNLKESNRFFLFLPWSFLVLFHNLVASSLSALLDWQNPGSDRDLFLERWVHKFCLQVNFSGLLNPIYCEGTSQLQTLTCWTSN